MNKKLIISLAVSFAVVAGVSIPLAIVLPKLIESRKNSGDHIHAYVTKYDKDGHWQECECGEKTDKVAHNMQKDSFTYRTCNAGDQTCYKCTDCDYEICENGKERLSHKFKTTITTEASCTTVGVKHLQCELCQQSFDIAYTSNNAHKWGDPSVSAGVTTYVCNDCGKELKLLDHSTSTNATVDSSTLADVGTIKLKEASITFDNSTLNSFSSDVTVSVDKVENASASYSIVNTETKELIADAPVFNFSLKDGEDDIHEFAGAVTVELPYVLSEGEDPDNISIAYVPEGEGEVEYIPASYANGKVTFETSHFSLYAIIRLSAEDCCKKFGHNLIKGKTEPSTCVEHGHEIHSCTRCGAQILDELELAEHKYVFNNSVPSTATEHGYIEKKCSVCGDIIREELPLIPAGDDSYALTFLRSIVDSNFEANVGVERYEIEDGKRVDDYSENINFVFGVNSEHPFMMESFSSGDDDVVDTSIYTTDGYYSSYNHRFSEGGGTVNDIFKALAIFKSEYKCLDKVSDLVYNVLTRTVLTKTTKDGFDYYSLDTAKLRGLVESCKTDSTKDIIDKIFGEGFYNELLGIVEKLYNNKVSEVLDYLNELGYPVKEILDLVSVFYYSGDDTSLYDRIFTESVLNTRCIDLISNYVNLEDYRIPTFEKFKVILNGFLANSPLDLLTNFVSEDIDFEATAEAYIKFADEYVSNFELKTTSYGQFVSANVEVLLPSGHPVRYGEIIYEDDTQDAEQEPYTNFRKISVSVNNNIDIAKDYELALEEIAKCEKLKNSFTRDIVLTKFEEYLESLYGVEFTYYEEDDIRGQAFFESARSSSITRETALLSEEDYAKYESILRIYVGSRYYHNWDWENFYYYRYEDMHDVYGKKDSSEVFYISMYISVSEIRFDVNNGGSSTFNKDIGYSLNCCYDFETDEYFVAQPQTHRYVVTEITASEYKNHYNDSYYNDRVDYLVEEGCKFYKITCKDCDEVKYDYEFGSYYYYYGSETVLTKDSNAEARQYRITVNRNEYYYSYNSNRITRVYVSKIGSGINLPLSHLDSGENRFKNETYTFGNVSIAYTYKSGSHACDKIETITIKINNKIYDTYVNRLHLPSGVTDNDTYRDDGCNHYHTYTEVCNDCGKILNTWTDSWSNHNYEYTYSNDRYEGCYHYYHVHGVCKKCGQVTDYDDYTTNHEYEKVDTVNSGVLFEIFDVYKCKYCDNCYTSYVRYTEPHDVEYQEVEYEEGKYTYLWHCDECDQDYLMPYHYHFEYMNPDYYRFSFWGDVGDKISVGEADPSDYYCIGFRDMTSYYGYNWNRPDSSWVCYIGLLPTDSDGNIDLMSADPNKYQEFDFNSDGEVRIEYNHYHGYSYYRSVYASMFAFEKSLIDGYLESAEENEKLYFFFIHRYTNDAGKEETIIQVYEFPEIPQQS